MKFKLLYVTVPDMAQAERIAAALVEDRLVACANLLPGASSIYRWQGRIERANEIILVAKTREGLVDAAITRIKAMHSYSVPGAVALPIEAGDPDYLRWLAGETEGA